MTLGAVPARLEEQEQEITAQAESAREKIAELTALLEGLETAAEENRTTRKTLLALPEPAPPAPPAPKLPDHPAYRPTGLPADHGGIRRGRRPAAGTGGL